VGKEFDDWLTNLANQIKKRRKELGISQQELATRARLSIGTVARIETRVHRNPSLETIEAIGHALEVKDSLSLLKKS
jgi:transcriptional regulator with XRE-family HTH domain